MSKSDLHERLSNFSESEAMRTLQKDVLKCRNQILAAGAAMDNDVGVKMLKYFDVNWGLNRSGMFKQHDEFDISPCYPHIKGLHGTGPISSYKFIEFALKKTYTDAEIIMAEHDRCISACFLLWYFLPSFHYFSIYMH